ncbi:hypothetical protein [Micromonospora carbonacea]|uniref:Uncharacterized protein n=1 Tax=Micromonospora carbonacea TaxID=47853 RepID=A0A1C5ACL1_9ACTN|nr:hypothetical protein [Micromonospora carbonacea]SCF42977.1 hypothetical protein GA0070563_112167 [Micromonospora carbonacea]
MSLHPNAVLPCPSESARRRHAAHGQTCPVCDTAAVPSLAAVLADNQRLTERLADADRVMRTLLRFPVIQHEVLNREHHRLFPTSRLEGAAA